MSSWRFVNFVSVVSLLLFRTAEAKLQIPLDNRPLATVKHGDPFTNDFAKFVDGVMEDWKVPGMSIAVIDGDDVYTEGFGYATLPNVQVTPETLFMTGSTSKAFTAAILAQLIHSKNYSALSNGWSTPISSIIRDDFVLQDNWATNHVNLDDAASHRTGMPRHDLSTGLKDEYGNIIMPGDIVRNLRNLRPSAEPRTTWQYCNLMYITLAHVVETLTGKWLGDTMRELIWEPLSMNATFGDTEDALAAPEHLASGYFWDEEKQSYIEMPFESTRESSGAGMVISNVIDYVKWVRCLLYETQPFSKQEHRDLRKPRMLQGAEARSGPGDTSYGLAWQKKVAHGAVLYKHGGTMLAYGTQVFWLPEINYAIIAMGNIAGSANFAEEVILWRLIEDKLRIPQADRFNISAALKEIVKRQNHELENAEDILYPNRPKVPIPSPLDHGQIAGKYFDLGYGTLHIVEVASAGQSSRTSLVAKRPDMQIPYDLRFEHTSGNFWIVNILLEGMNSTIGYWAGEFKVGVDGEATSLEIKLSIPGAEIDEGTVLFKRVKD